jgi:hypothetical protein
VRFIILGVLAAGLCLPSSVQTAVPAPAGGAKDQFFSGYITSISDTSITVNRTVLGSQSSTRTFAITPETRIEGKPKVKARVTVEYVGEDEGDRAVHIIVRTSQPKKQT